MTSMSISDLISDGFRPKSVRLIHSINGNWRLDGNMISVVPDPNVTEPSHATFEMRSQQSAILLNAVYWPKMRAIEVRSRRRKMLDA